MFRFSGFTQKANNAINVAMAEAGAMGHTYIGSEHLVLGMLDRGSGVAHTVLGEKNITFDAFRRTIIQGVGGGGRTSLTPEDFTPRCKRTLEMAIIKARIMGHSSVGTEHILMVLAKEKDSCAVRLLAECGVDIEKLVEDMADSICLELAESGAFERERSRRTILKAPVQPGPAPKSQPTPHIDKYSRDLTARARAGAIDPVVGRESEIERIIQILSRRGKNHF
jgi:ATP-dependent Clp protease ATP-binding subunit ClpC